MFCEIVEINPDLANEILQKNPSNRKINNITLKRYEDLMKGGYWEENGEPIIIDEKGNLRDGQHRLMAVIKSGISFNVPIVRGVKSNKSVMSSFDSGRLRSLNDVFYIAGYQKSKNTAIVAKMIGYCDIDEVNLFRAGFGVPKIEILRYYEKNKFYIDYITELSESLYKSQTIKVIRLSYIALILDLLNKGNIINEVYKFMRIIVGVESVQGSSQTWIFNQLLKAKQNKIKLQDRFLINSCIRSWNMYVTGNPPIKFMKINLDELPSSIQINKLD